MFFISFLREYGLSAVENVESGDFLFFAGPVAAGGAFVFEGDLAAVEGEVFDAFEGGAADGAAVEEFVGVAVSAEDLDAHDAGLQGE